MNVIKTVLPDRPMKNWMKSRACLPPMVPAAILKFRVLFPPYRPRPAPHKTCQLPHQACILLAINDLAN